MIPVPSNLRCIFYPFDGEYWQEGKKEFNKTAK